MASSTSIALRRLAGRNGLLFRPLASVSVTRSFNTNAEMARVDKDEREDRSPVYRRRRRGFPGGLLSDVFDPFAPSPTRSVSALMNLMDQLAETPSSMLGGGGVMRRGWDVREDEEALQLKVDMPGLGKEDVKISVDDNTLIIKGEGEKESEDEEERRRYSSRIDLTPNAYKIDGIKAEMKNGVLKVTVPKLKYEDRKDVYQVQVN